MPAEKLQPITVRSCEPSPLLTASGCRLIRDGNGDLISFDCYPKTVKFSQPTSGEGSYSHTIIEASKAFPNSSEVCQDVWRRQLSKPRNKLI